MTLCFMGEGNEWKLLAQAFVRKNVAIVQVNIEKSGVSDYTKWLHWLWQINGFIDNIN